jgi:hypothetical protein
MRKHIQNAPGAAGNALTSLTPTLSPRPGRGRTIRSVSRLASRVPDACLPSPWPQGEGKGEGSAGKRTRIWAACLALLIGLSLFSPPALAQTLEPPSPRQGYYLSVGLHNGIIHTWEDDESLGTWLSGGFTIRLGQMLTRRLGLGLQIFSGSAKKDEEHSTTFGLGLEGQVALTGRLAMTGGLALGVLQLHDDRVENEELRGAFGAEYSLGASYDFFPYKRKLSGGLGLAPIVQVRFLPGDEATSISVLAGLHISWWTGLPRNQLDLPPGEGYERD